MGQKHIIRNSAYYQNLYNEGVADELISANDGSYGSEPTISTDYTEIDKRLDEEAVAGMKDFLDRRYAGIPDEYRPIHNYRWAMKMARECYHLTCNSTEKMGMRLVYAQDNYTLRSYNQFGFTVKTIPPSEIEKESRTWRLWTDDPKIIEGLKHNG